jgi:hypothetical protein
MCWVIFGDVFATEPRQRLVGSFKGDVLGHWGGGLGHSGKWALSLAEILYMLVGSLANMLCAGT